ncbi:MULTISPECIES: SpoIIE family protein phosphatase [Dethiosulfovibrio]|uniref:SpoIIE family protein phosphatase n=2 Tax=Dethiosulfovibrio TaxID=47054 RepID=A0ABS9EP45_9BACT|nr:MULTISPECIES: SpoIIE family protein phosphatase [Dethiosulfovibrio]MCF4114382.1 SpoIIE family protein phosphatase [Dethiosulfovibrio russensis]MCF4142957.1 SpoIIE family protein phosphatase [Dethiosulfovibrio marinus]MCF4145054.1 SpoIIE family protein phosphatase [Dethiosulfovibrio acidaminovorans]
MKIKGSIASRLILSTLIGAGCVLLAIVGYGFVHARSTLKQEIISRVEGLAEGTSFKVGRIPLVVETVGRDLAVGLSLSDLSEDDVYSILEGTLRVHPEVSGVCLAFFPQLKNSRLRNWAPFAYRDDGGIHRKNLGGNGYDREIWDWYQLPKELGRPVWTEPYFGVGGSDRLLISYCIPLYDSDGSFMASLACDVSLDWLTDTMTGLRSYDDGYAFLITSAGTVVSHPDRDLIMNETIFSIADAEDSDRLWNIGDSMRKGEYGLVEMVDFTTGEPSWIAYRPVGDMGWSIGIVFPRRALIEPLHDLSKSQLMLGLVGLALLFIVSFVIARSITGPIKSLSVATKLTASGDLESYLPSVTGDDEVAQLARSFASMREDLLAYVEELQETTAAREKMESELNIAHSIQLSLVPRTFPPFPEMEEFDLYALLDPAKEVGGDFYDFFMVDPGHILITVGDVSGKGVPAALFMAVTRTFIRAFAKEGLGPGAILSRLNDEISVDNESCMFVTVFCAVIDLENGDFLYASGGHNPPFLLGDGSVGFLPKVKGPLVGPMSGMVFQEGRSKIEAGETLFLYTDGLTEAMDGYGRLLGEEKSILWLEEMDGISSKDMVLAMRDRTASFVDGAEQSDDITLLAFRFRGPSRRGN